MALVFTLFIALAIFCATVSSFGKSPSPSAKGKTTSASYGLYEYISIYAYSDPSGSLTTANACDTTPEFVFTFRPGHCFYRFSRRNLAVDADAVKALPVKKSAIAEVTTKIVETTAVKLAAPFSPIVADAANTQSGSATFSYLMHNTDTISFVKTSYSDDQCNDYSGYNDQGNTYHIGCNTDGAFDFVRVAATNTWAPTAAGVSLTMYRPDTIGQTQCQDADDAGSGKSGNSQLDADDSMVYSYFFPTGQCVTRLSTDNMPSINGNFVRFTCNGDGTFGVKHYDDSDCQNETVDGNGSSTAETYSTGDSTCSNAEYFNVPWFFDNEQLVYRWDCVTPPTPVPKKTPGLKKNGQTKAPSFKSKKMAARV